MEESILVTIKKLLGINSDDTSFDTDLITNINAAISSLVQMGIGSSTFILNDDNDKWTDFISETNVVFHMVKMYIYMKVRLIFDPPTSSIAVESMNNLIKEYEYRMYHEVNFMKEDS